MLILMNLAQDLDQLVTEHLLTFGYLAGDQDTPIHRFCIWFEHSERFVPHVPHQIELSQELRTNPKYESLKPVIEEIANKLRQGRDITPYQSNRAPKLASRGRDHLLIHWGIRHLHLSLFSTMQSNGFVTRSDELLFFRVHGNAVYLIDILAHAEPDVFEEKRLLEIVDRNWPFLHMQVNGISVGRQSTPKEIKTHRRNNMSYFGQVNGRLIMPTMGPSAAGTPTEASLSFNRHQRELHRLETEIRRDLLSYFPKCAEQWIAHIRLLGVWDKGFDIYEISTNQSMRIQINA